MGSGCAHFGYLGKVRTLEVMHAAAHGWHLYFYIPLPLESGTPSAMAEAMCLFVPDRWMAVVARLRGGECCQAAQPSAPVSGAEDAARYLPRRGVALELTHPRVEEGRGGGRTHWQILVGWDERRRLRA